MTVFGSLLHSQASLRPLYSSSACVAAVGEGAGPTPRGHRRRGAVATPPGRVRTGGEAVLAAALVPQRAAEDDCFSPRPLNWVETHSSFVVACASLPITRWAKARSAASTSTASNATPKAMM